MTEQELKKEQFIAKAMANKEKFALHKKLIEENLCIGGKMYIEDLKIFAERQVVDNELLLNLMQYAESFAENDKTNPVQFAEWTQLEGWGYLGENKWIHKSSLVVSSSVLFDLYSTKAE
jgi:hypothetical protein